MAKPRRSRRTLTTLVVLVLLSVTVISLDESGRTHDLTSGVKSVASDVFSPFRSGVNAILNPIGDFFAGAVHYRALEQENSKLQTEVGTLRQQLGSAGYQRREYRQLQQLLASEKLPPLSGFSEVVAASTAVDASNFAATLTIDKGRSAGVAVGDPVIGAGGLVGKVVQASHSTAIVRLITDGTSEVGVTFGNGQFATLDGRGAGRPMSAQFVAATTPATKGEHMVTDGLQGAEFPSGIPVATVSRVRTVTGAADKVVTALPVADLHALSYVAVVQWAPTP